MSGETQANPEIVHGVADGRFQLLFFSLEMLIAFKEMEEGAAV